MPTVRPRISSIAHYLLRKTSTLGTNKDENKHNMSVKTLIQIFFLTLENGILVLVFVFFTDKCPFLSFWKKLYGRLLLHLFLVKTKSPTCHVSTKLESQYQLGQKVIVQLQSRSGSLRLKTGMEACRASEMISLRTRVSASLTAERQIWVRLTHSLQQTDFKHTKSRPGMLLRWRLAMCWSVLNKSKDGLWPLTWRYSRFSGHTSQEQECLTAEVHCVLHGRLVITKEGCLASSRVTLPVLSPRNKRVNQCIFRLQHRIFFSIRV